MFHVKHCGNFEERSKPFDVTTASCQVSLYGVDRFPG
jgi:hypothetical protein